MKKKIIAGILLFTALLSTAYAGDAGKAFTVSSESWTDATNEDGTGLYWDIFRAVYEPAGIKMNMKFRSYIGSVKLLEHGKIDAMVGAYIDEIDEAIYPRHHFGVDVVQTIYSKGSVSSWKGEETLKDKKAAWIKGYAFDDYLKTPVVKKEYDNRDVAFRLLEKGRLDFFLDAKGDLEDYIKAASVDLSRYHVQTVMKLKLYLVFSNTPKGKELARIFDERYPELLKSGEIKKLYDKYIIDKKANFTYPW